MILDYFDEVLISCNHLLNEVLILSNHLSVLVNGFLSAIDFFRLSNEVLISSNHLFSLGDGFPCRVSDGFLLATNFLIT